MDEVKPILESKTVWAGIAVIISQLAHIAGYQITDADAQTIVEYITTVCTIVSGLCTIYGRVKATKLLTTKTIQGAK